LNSPRKDDTFYLEHIEFGVKQLGNGKAKDIESYQAKTFKMGVLVLIPHVDKLFELLVKQGFVKPWKQSLTVYLIKSGDKSILSSYKNIRSVTF